MNKRGMPLGVIYQEYWTRKRGSMDLPEGEKESQKWLKGLVTSLPELSQYLPEYGQKRYRYEGKIKK
jgi:hypothetical protein